MEKPIISVVIPVYRASSTIERCSRSLFEQTLTDGVEFLFVDDCSPDNSIEILKGVINSYPNLKDSIIIIRNSYNLGVSETRKKGIREARGEYIAWVDSDDWIEPTMLETMWNATQYGSIDIVVQNVIVDSYRDGRVEKSREWKLYPQEDAMHALMNYHTDKYVPWGLPFQMSRRSLISDVSKYVHNVSITEDTVMLIYLFAKARSCFWLERAFYHYVSIENSTSLTHRDYLSKEEWSQQEKNIDDVVAFLLQLDRKQYRVTTNYIKWLWKNRFQPIFDNSWKFWRKYRECYFDVTLFFDGDDMRSVQKKIKVWLVYNIYPLYWYIIGRHLSFKND